MDFQFLLEITIEPSLALARINEGQLLAKFGNKQYLKENILFVSYRLGNSNHICYPVQIKLLICADTVDCNVIKDISAHTAGAGVRFGLDLKLSAQPTIAICHLTLLLISF